MQGQRVHLATTAAFPFIIRISPFNLMIHSIRCNHLCEGTHKHSQAYITSIKEKNIFPRVYRFAHNTEARSCSATHKIPEFLEPQILLACTQQFATCLYPESDQSTSRPPIIFL